MALLAESLVDEWLNRQGFFTVRGLKQGVSEIDLLAVRPERGRLVAWHVEVQASFRPVGYISELLREHVPSFAKSKKSVKRRPSEILSPCVTAWVEKKFRSRLKVRARERAWGGLEWRFVFVHGTVREPEELRLIKSSGIHVLPLHYVLFELRHEAGKMSGGAGTDLAELIEYYNGFVNDKNRVAVKI